MQTVHFIGIGGVGMNGLAQLALDSGCSVTGSDRAYDAAQPTFRMLDQLGASLVPQDGSGIGPHTDGVVYSTAIEADNPDLVRAETLGIPLLHRADFLNRLIGNDQLIAVAGTAGKTTTTGMLGWIFESLGMDPSVYNGAAVLNWRGETRPGNVRRGTSDLWIIEADESDRSFLKFRPTHSVITNIARDHYELAELHRLFDAFEAQTKEITIRGPGDEADSIELQMSGRHNLENGACALRLCTALGLDRCNVLQALSRFKGIERRLEDVGTTDGIRVIDDYAHNAAKIEAALTTVRSAGHATHVYWRPHGYTPLAQGLDDLAEVFTAQARRNGGLICILPVYYAGGTVKPTVTHQDLVDRIRDAGGTAHPVQDYDELRTLLEAEAVSGDVILGMGARDPELPRFAAQLVDTWKKT